MTELLSRTEAPTAGQPALEPTPEDAGKLASHYLGVADALARRYRYPGHDPEDLRQVARLALVVAARRYREGIGQGFVPYAVPTITGSIKRYIRDQSWVVRPPRSLQELRLDVNAARRRLTQELGREPTAAELSREVGVPEESIAEAQIADAAMVGVSIEPLDPSGDALPDPTSHVVAEIEPGFERVERRHLLATALDGLSDEDKRLLKMRFVDEMSQSQIAEVLGVSQMQVSRLLRKLLERMRRKVAA